MEQRTLIQTAFSMHSQCFICKRRSNRLHKVNQSSIVYAYKHYRIFIKHHARSCQVHLDEKKNIKYDEFINIQSRLMPHNMQITSLLNSYLILNNSLGVFDQFKEINLINEGFFIILTGWTKAEFIRFSNCITSIHDTNVRTKEQLIAVYRFWLRKGSDHTSIAYLKNNTSSQQISHYLSQIREAINKDFVPYFLGAKHLNRELFIKKNKHPQI